jgi:mono/diheme cytochrome c family protein
MVGYRRSIQETPSEGRMSFHSGGPRQLHLALMLAVVAVGVWNRSAAAQQQQAGRASKVEYEGWRQYMITCARCHGDDAVGGVMAPDLRASVAKGMDQATFETVVSAGRPEKGMPGFKGTLSKEQIDAIYAYVSARAKGRLPAGRPKPM